MKNTFVKDLWEKNPELVIKAIIKVGKIDEELAKRLSFKGIDEKGSLEFGAHRSFDYCNVCVGDFNISGTEYIDRGGVRNTRFISNSVGWMKFLYSVYDDKFALQFISQRNQQLDKFMAEYEEKYNEETRHVLDKMGYGINKDHTK